MIDANPSEPAAPTPARQRRRQARRREILDAALALVRAGGLESLTTHRVAADVDLTVGALYRYFTGKDALIAALQVEALGAWRLALGREATALRARLDPYGAPWSHLAVLAGLARCYVALARSEPGRFALIEQTLADPRVLVPDDAAAEVIREAVLLLAEVGRWFAAAERGDALEPGGGHERPILFWSTLRAVLQIAKLEAREPRLRVADLCDHAARTLLRGWGARDADLEMTWQWLDGAAAPGGAG